MGILVAKFYSKFDNLLFNWGEYGNQKFIKYKNYIIGFILFQIALAAVSAIYNIHFFVILALFLLVAFALSLFSIERTILFAILYTTILPASYYDITFLPIYVSFNITHLLIIIALIYWFFDLFFHKNLTLRIDSLDTAMFVFIIIIAISAFIGYKNGNTRWVLVWEIILTSLYITYFLFVHGVNRVNAIRNFHLLLTFVAIVCSLEFIYQALVVNTALFNRVSTQQIHLAQISLPFLTGYFFYTKVKTRKLLCIILMIPIIFMVIISMTRALWVATFFSILLMIFFYNWKGKNLARKVFQLSFFIVIMSVIVILSVTSMSNIRGHEVGESMNTRVQSFEELEQDASLIIRAVEILQVLERTKTSPIWGMGLGDEVMRILRWGISNSVDNTFVWIYWKMGLIGLFTYSLVIVLFIKRCIFVLKRVNDERQKLYVTTALSSFVGLLLISLTNTCLILYRFNIIWAILIASVEIIARKIENEYL